MRSRSETLTLTNGGDFGKEPIIFKKTIQLYDAAFISVIGTQLQYCCLPSAHVAVPEGA